MAAYIDVHTLLNVTMVTNITNWHIYVCSKLSTCIFAFLCRQRLNDRKAAVSDVQTLTHMTICYITCYETQLRKDLRVDPCQQRPVTACYTKTRGCICYTKTCDCMLHKDPWLYVTQRPVAVSRLHKDLWLYVTQRPVTVCYTKTRDCMLHKDPWLYVTQRPVAVCYTKTRDCMLHKAWLYKCMNEVGENALQILHSLTIMKPKGLHGAHCC